MMQKTVRCPEGHNKIKQKEILSIKLEFNELKEFVFLENQNAGDVQVIADAYSAGYQTNFANCKHCEEGIWREEVIKIEM